MKINNTMSSARNMKIILLGESGSGKSSLISAYLFGQPILPKKPIIFGSYCRDITVRDEDFRLNICDSSGEKSFTRLQSISYLDADLLVICVDASKQGCLKKAEEYAEKTSKSNVPVILCVNKIDLDSRLQDSEIKGFVEKYSMNGYIRCTANDNKKVVEAFERMIFFAKAKAITKPSGCLTKCNWCC